MLINPKPDEAQLVPGTQTYRKFTYVSLNPSSHAAGRVFISALLYADKQSLFANQTCGECFLGSVEYDINAAGVLDKAQDYARGFFPGFKVCKVPVDPNAKRAPDEAPKITFFGKLKSFFKAA